MSSLLISSKQNPVYKDLLGLRQKKNRSISGRFIAEGLRFCEESLVHGSVSMMVFSETFASGKGADLLQLAAQKEIRTFIFPDILLDSLCDTETPQGVLSVVAQTSRPVSSLAAGARRLVFLDALQDPGNLGTIMRTADAAGFDGIVLSPGCVDVYNPKVLRATMGAIFRTPLYTCSSALDALKFLQHRGFLVASACLDGAIPYHSADLTGNVVLVIGNEANGVSPEVQTASDIRILIPMPGQAESLNAAIAAGVLIFECIRPRN